MNLVVLDIFRQSVELNTYLQPAKMNLKIMSLRKAKQWLGKVI